MESNKQIYLDYHATTPVDPRVAEKVLALMTTQFGNASSVDHAVGDRARAALDQAKQAIADLIHCRSQEITFTSGATESLNLAIQGTVLALEKQQKIPRIAISAVEHKAVLDTCYHLEKQGRIELITLPVDAQANLNLNEIEEVCHQGLDLLCVMAANNEVGTIYPIESIAAIAKRYSVPFLCDASQAIGKIPINFQDWGITLLAMSGHKLYAPQGIGALIRKSNHRLEPLFLGGGQQQGLRPGTLNLPGIVGLGEACRLRQLEMEVDETAIAQKRNYLQTRLQTVIPEIIVNGNQSQRLAGNLHIAIPDIPNSAIIARIREQIAISTGSACSSGTITPSHVLRAMNLPDNFMDGALRIGIGKFTTDADIEQAADILAKVIQAVQISWN
ncbi:cysteine desulfurase family protein [Synechocystis salina]|uniref:Cysteine desulfurase n=1 Tax=Synechocystis salina LEGE 00031 TaxID=1828736 RepID=A0ABR9VUC4_9SYNC|nr:cysteine desulfurase family protein [Synechocystis salina]MBE9241570.1 cysteine desulfurase [Synechocystis salina LEGE 00041]MBE9254944.1 cysteine desulfurase [Synechocystis salina LEGE 00031]